MRRACVIHAVCRECQHDVGGLLDDGGEQFELLHGEIGESVDEPGGAGEEIPLIEDVIQVCEFLGRVFRAVCTEFFILRVDFGEVAELAAKARLLFKHLLGCFGEHGERDAVHLHRRVGAQEHFEEVRAACAGLVEIKLLDDLVYGGSHCQQTRTVVHELFIAAALRIDETCEALKADDLNVLVGKAVAELAAALLVHDIGGLLRCQDVNLADALSLHLADGVHHGLAADVAIRI